MRHVGERARAKGKTGLKVRYVSDRTDCRFFFFILKESASFKIKNAPRDAHSRVWKMSQATALGARVRKADSLFHHSVQSCGFMLNCAGRKNKRRHYEFNYDRKCFKKLYGADAV